jgi:flagellar motor protein MotB
MTTVGYGEMQPVATNESASGREANRRVEVAIMANEELRAQAEKQAAGQGE